MNKTAYSGLNDGLDIWTGDIRRTSDCQHDLAASRQGRTCYQHGQGVEESKKKTCSSCADSCRDGRRMMRRVGRSCMAMIQQDAVS